VTDLAMLKSDALEYTSAKLVADFVGSGAHVRAGSPAEHPEAFRSPVLMFHGEVDLNVPLRHSLTMERALKGAGRVSEMVVYPQLDHGLRDGNARADMLRRADAFLRQHLGM
jgi:dipeptidyl aminopeptidase/acylaminoacyl peptidase